MVTAAPTPAFGETGTRFLDTYAEAGWSQDDVMQVATAWHILTDDLELVWLRANKQAIAIEEANFQTRITGYQYENLVAHRASLNTDEIIGCPEEELPEWRDYYLAELRDHHDDMTRLETIHETSVDDKIEYQEVRATVGRLSWYLWQVRHRLGDV